MQITASLTRLQHTQHACASKSERGFNQEQSSCELKCCLTVCLNTVIDKLSLFLLYTGKLFTPEAVTLQAYHTIVHGHFFSTNTSHEVICSQPAMELCSSCRLHMLHVKMFSSCKECLQFMQNEQHSALGARCCVVTCCMKEGRIFLKTR